MSRLTQIIALLYKMQPEDQQLVQERIVALMKTAWGQAIEDEAKRYGCRKAKASAPRREDLAYLQNIARQDAESITRTYNREVERQIEKLYAANPKGNRHYYAKRMEVWIDKRKKYKIPLIALQTNQNIRGWAKQRFWQMNAEGVQRYKLTGPPPVCKTCARLIGMGAVSEEVYRRYFPTVHIGCTHEWQTAVPDKIPCEEMWLG